MDEMIKDSVRKNPSLMHQYRKTKANLLSDGSVQGNTTYGKWAVERKDISEAIFLGCKFYMLFFEDGCQLKKCRGLKSSVLEEMDADDIRPLLHDPVKDISGVNSVIRYYRSLMATASESKNIGGGYDKRVFRDGRFDQTISIDKFLTEMNKIRLT